MSGIFGQIKRSILCIIASVVLIVLSLPVSFAVDSIVCPMPEPEVYNRSTGSGYEAQFYYVFYTSQTNDRQPAEYTLNVLSYSGSESVDFAFYSWGRLQSYPVASKPVSFSLVQYDALNGNFLSLTTTEFTTLVNINGSSWYRPYGTSNYPNFAGTATWNVYANISPSTNYLYDYRVVAPFVTWSQQPLEHNIYHSELSEPVADEYNSYFICNDRLYWLSYRANGLYSFSQTVELSSQAFEEPVSYSSSGSGTYVGQQNGYTEPVSGYAPYFTGSTGDGTIVTGTLTPPDFGQIDFVGVNQGQLRVNSNGQFTYNDLEVFPVSVNNQILNRLFDVIIYLTDSSGFKVWLCPRSDLGLSLVVDASLFCSVFDLTNGEYISSSFSSYTGSYDHAGFDFPLEDEIADVRCYGCAFYNVNNVPVGLSDVLWQYDLEFVQWRDSMLSVLNQIRSLLSGEDQTFPEPGSYPDYAGSLQESDSGFSNIQAADIKLELNNALGDGKYDHAAGQVKEWIDLFSIPKIIGVCILALALGTVTLTLGKKKSD